MLLHCSRYQVKDKTSLTRRNQFPAVLGRWGQVPLLVRYSTNHDSTLSDNYARLLDDHHNVYWQMHWILYRGYICHVKLHTNHIAILQLITY